MRYCLIIRQNAEEIQDKFIMKTLQDFGVRVEEIKPTDIKVNLESENHQAALPGREIWFSSDIDRETLHETLKRILGLNETRHQSFLLEIKNN